MSKEKFAAGKGKAQQAVNNILYYSKRLYHYVPDAYRFYCLARQRHHQRQERLRLGLPGLSPGTSQQALATFGDNSITRTAEIGAIATQIGLRVDEVPALALMLVGPLLATEDFISAVAEVVTKRPRESVYSLWQYALDSWLRFSQGVSLFKLSVFSLYSQGVRLLKISVLSLLILFASLLCNARRAALPLMIIGNCFLVVGLEATLVLMVCCPILIAFHWWL